MTTLFSLLSRLGHLPIRIIPLVIPPSTDGRVRLASTAMPRDICPHGSDEALAYLSSLSDTRGGHLVVSLGGRRSSLETGVEGPHLVLELSLSENGYIWAIEGTRHFEGGCWQMRDQFI